MISILSRREREKTRKRGKGDENEKKKWKKTEKKKTNSLVVEVRHVELLAGGVRQVLVVLFEDLVEAEVVEVDVSKFRAVDFREREREREEKERRESEQKMRKKEKEEGKKN